MLAAVVLTVIAAEAVVTPPLSVTVEGLILQVISALLEQPTSRLTDHVNPFCDVTVTVTDPKPPGFEMEMLVGLGLVESAKSGPTRVMEAVDPP